MKSLKDLCNNWRAWAKSAEKSEDGWQSFYPKWDELMETAKLAMLQSSRDSEILMEIEFCWSISEETEDLAEFAKENIEECIDILEILSNSHDKNVRWQVYSAFGTAGRKAELFLRKGLCDPDLYCRRRALLSMAQISPGDSKELAVKFMNDPDPYMRQASIELLRSVKDIAFKRKAKEQLIGDDNPHVVEAAKKILIS
jgi:hypothetical protein